MIETIRHRDRLIAYLIGSAAGSDKTSFFTGDDASFQAGFVVYPADGTITPHVHLPIERRVVGTSEFLLVRQGRCVVDLYAEDKTYVTSREMAAGDAILLVEGGHGFRMLEDTVLFEIKQGPYGGLADKERFEASGEPAAH